MGTSQLSKIIIMRLKVKLKNPKITQSEIKEKLNLSRSKVQRTMKKLVNEGVIENIGSHRSGNWKVNKHL